MVRMLHFNAPPVKAAPGGGDEDTYKVLILDRHTKVAAALLRWLRWQRWRWGAGGASTTTHVAGLPMPPPQAPPPAPPANRLPPACCGGVPWVPRCDARLPACLPVRPQDILAPLLHVNELRKHGVTLHLLLDSERQPIPDVPAVYFVEVRRTAACRDCVWAAACK